MRRSFASLAAAFVCWLALAAPFAQGAPEGAAVAESTDEVGIYLEIPIVGAIGVDVSPVGVETCLRYVSQNPRIKHVVLRIKSPGGDLGATERILDLLQKQTPPVKCHALVEQANGVAALLAFACDTIHMTPWGTLGGASAVPLNAEGGERLDAGAAASLASKYAAAAAAKGYPEAVVRAMIMPDTPICAWVGDGGKIQFGPQVDFGADEEKVIFRSPGGSLLVLNREQAVKSRIALWSVEGVRDLGDFLGLAGWQSAGDYGNRVMHATRRGRERDVEQGKTDAGKLKDAMARNDDGRKAVQRAIQENLEEAQRHETAATSALQAMDSGDPGRFLERVWKLEVRAAVESWIKVQTYCRALVLLEAEARKFNTQLDQKLEEWRGGKSPPPALAAMANDAESWRLKPLESGFNLSDILARAERSIDRLKREGGLPRRGGP